MRKMNLVFAAVFAAALVLGAVNVFTAVGGADKGGIKAVDVVGASDISRPVDKTGTDVNYKKNMVRSGRKIQVDGFLLEWRDEDANVWPGSNWRWDAVSTVDGVAGYVSLPAGAVKDMGIKTNDTVIKVVNDVVDNIGNNVTDDTVNSGGANAVARSDLILTLRAVNTGRSLSIKFPGQPSGELFAFDKGEFDAGGPLTAEWIVPWEYFDDDEDDSATYELALDAEGVGAGVLQPLVLTVVAPSEPRASGGLLTRLTMVALIVALTAALIVMRRRQVRERY